MDYIGSKEKVNEWMFSKMLNGIDPKKETFLDACTGSASVSKYAAKSGFSKIISNDIMEFPSHIARGSISLPKSKLDEATALIDKMNVLSGVEGFFYKNYSEQSGRLFFTNANAKKIDACRQYIEKNVSDIYIRSYLLYCMLESFSAVSNCTGVHAAFLKEYKERALKEFIIKPRPSLHLSGLVKTFNKDILSLLKSQSKERRDIKETTTYIDPPYNQRQYGPNYHLYETLVKYDDPVIAGKAGLRNWKEESKSPFCSKKGCASFTKEVVDSTCANRIFISYNSDGLLSKDEFMDTFNGYKIKLYTMVQKRYKSDASVEREYNKTELLEYLFEIAK
jgi:adenine-specific DNA-methyltransferase